MKSVLCHLYSCVQPPLCGFKHKPSFMHLQKPSHRSIFFKEMLRFASSDNAATLSNVTHEERGNFPKNIPSSSLCHPHVQSFLEDRAERGSHALQGWSLGRNHPSSHCQAAQGRAGFPFPPQHRVQHSQSFLGVHHNNNNKTIQKNNNWPQDFKSKALSYKPC